VSGKETLKPHAEAEVEFAAESAADPAELHDRKNDSGQSQPVQRVVSFNQIAGGTTEVIIEHEGQQYRLRATRNGRLLLNK
jgi:hemin uptake protein HemP